MKMIFKSGPVEIWSVRETWGTDYWVFGTTVHGDPLVYPSLGMARERAAAGPAR